MAGLRSGMVALLWTTAAWAAPAEGPSTHDMQGTLGPSRIGFELVIKQDRILGGHYFYASHLTDIPLTGMIEGETLTLQEPAAGRFRLHFTGSGPSKGQPLTFNTAVGLTGDWSQNGKTLPVTLRFESVMPGPAPAHRYRDVTNESDEAFEARVRAFVTAALKGDAETVAGTISYPLRLNGRKPITITTKAALIAHWQMIDTGTFRAALAQAMPHDMFVHNGQAMIGNGLVWFDGHGAAAINPP